MTATMMPLQLPVDVPDHPEVKLVKVDQISNKFRLIFESRNRSAVASAGLRKAAFDLRIMLGAERAGLDPIDGGQVYGVNDTHPDGLVNQRLTDPSRYRVDYVLALPG